MRYVFKVKRDGSLSSNNPDDIALLQEPSPTPSLTLILALTLTLTLILSLTLSLTLTLALALAVTLSRSCRAGTLSCTSPTPRICTRPSRSF